MEADQTELMAEYSGKKFEKILIPYKHWAVPEIQLDFRPKRCAYGLLLMLKTKTRVLSPHNYFYVTNHVSRTAATKESALEVTVSTPQGMLTTKQVCEYIGIAAHTFLEWRSTMRHTTPDAYRVGSQLRFRREDVEAWIESLKENGDLR